MKIIRSINGMRRYSSLLKRRNKTMGFVPTMGYLHEGHLSLVRRSKKENDATVVSVFVNPAQFGPKEDYAKYPRDFRKDNAALKGEGVDVMFCPGPADMYPMPYNTYVNVEGLTDGMCGRTRPGHFRGVATVVTKLFNIVRPDTAYFGQKDAQQAAVIKKMASDLNTGIKIKVAPTMREKGGLAMSSRNIYLSERQRQDAAAIIRSLKAAKRMILAGERSPGKVISAIRMMLKYKATKIDYVDIVDAGSMKPVKKIRGEIMIALAVFIGKTRLIDNVTLNTG